MYETTVGVVGAGAIGIAIAGHLARAGIDATISNGRDPASLSALVRNLGPTLRAGSFDEAVDPEIVFVAVPWLSIPDVLGRVADWEGRIVIDPTNPPTASVGMGVLGGRTSSEIVEEMVPGAHLVKAFNTLPAALLGAKPEAAGGGRRVIFYSGDHVRAKQEVARLMGPRSALRKSILARSQRAVACSSNFRADHWRCSTCSDIRRNRPRPSGAGQSGQEDKPPSANPASRTLR